MALHNLKIVVVDGGRAGSYRSKNAGGESGSKNDKKKYKDSPLYKMLNAKKTIKDKVNNSLSPASAFALDMGMRVASQVIKQTASYYISDIGRKNGDSNYQALINREIETITDPLSVAGGALAGATAGSMFGPVGAGIGLAIGATSSAISLGFKYAERARDYNHEMFKQDTSQAYALARTNFHGFTGRLR